MKLTFRFIALTVMAVWAVSAPLRAQGLAPDDAGDPAKAKPGLLSQVGIDQHLNQQVPLHLVFNDESGREVHLGELFGKRPVILAMVYYECPMLCTQVLNGLTGSLKGINLNAGKDFDVVAISFDPRDNDKPDLAKNKKLSYLEHYGRPGTDSGWHFLTGSQESIKAVTDAAGFKYEWDDKTQQFAHAAAVMVVTPEGKMSRYFYGIDYAPKDIKFGIMDSAQAKVGNPAEQLLLYCYHYDPASGKYGFAILRVMRLAGVATLLGLGAMAFVFWRKNKNNGSNNGQSTAV